MFRLPSGNGHACEAGFAWKCTSIVRRGAAFHNGCEVLCSGNATAFLKREEGLPRRLRVREEVGTDIFAMNCAGLNHTRLLSG